MVDRSCVLCAAIALLSLALPLVLLGCGSPMAASHGSSTPGATATSNTPIPTTLQIYRVGGLPGTNVAPFEAQSHHADKVQRLFSAMRSLPPFVGGSCPNDRGGAYILTFRKQNETIAQAIIPAGGCAKLVMSKPYGCHARPFEIVQQLADTLDVQQLALGLEGEFYDTSPPGSPTAPTTPKSPLLPFSSCR